LARWAFNLASLAEILAQIRQLGKHSPSLCIAGMQAKKLHKGCLAVTAFRPLENRWTKSINHCRLRPSSYASPTGDTCISRTPVWLVRVGLGVTGAHGSRQSSSRSFIAHVLVLRVGSIPHSDLSKVTVADLTRDPGTRTMTRRSPTAVSRCLTSQRQSRLSL
jgi:hypothetical protein